PKERLRWSGAISSLRYWGVHMAQEPAKYVIRFACEWGAGCLWPGNDAACDAFDLGPYDLHNPCPLPLSPTILQRCREFDTWHRTSLNLDAADQPGPWRQGECDRFNTAVTEMVADLQSELGPRLR